MIETHPLDTPINRATLEELPLEDAMSYIERIRTRRLVSYQIYEAGVEAKKRAKSEKSAQELQKCLDQFLKTDASIWKNIEKLEKIAQQINGHRIIMGDYSMAKED